MAIPVARSLSTRALVAFLCGLAAVGCGSTPPPTGTPTSTAAPSTTGTEVPSTPSGPPQSTTTPDGQTARPQPADESGWRIRLFGQVNDGDWRLAGEGAIRVGPSGIEADVFLPAANGGARIIARDEGVFLGTSARGASAWIDLTDPYNAPEWLLQFTISRPLIDGAVSVRTETVGGATLSVHAEPLPATVNGGTLRAGLIEAWVDDGGEVRRTLALHGLATEGFEERQLMVADRDDSVVVEPPFVSRAEAIPFAAIAATLPAESPTADHVAGIVSASDLTTANFHEECDYAWEYPAGGAQVSCPRMSPSLRLRPPDIEPLPSVVVVDSGNRYDATDVGTSLATCIGAYFAAMATYSFFGGATLFTYLGYALVFWNVAVVIALAAIVAAIILAGLACGHTLKTIEGWIKGEPHLTTFDGRSYDLQARCEFIFTTSPDLEVQLRFEGTVGSATWTNATAVRAGRHVIEFDYVPLADPNQPLEAYVNGASLQVPPGGLHLPGGVYVTRQSGGRNDENLLIVAPDGSYVVIQNLNVSQNVRIYLTSRTADQVSGGLGGTPDDDAANDFALRDGTSVTIIDTIEGLYGTFGAAWRVQSGERLFVTGQAEDNLSDECTRLPDRQTSLSDFTSGDIQQARDQCRREGVEETSALDECAYDVLVGGDEWALQAGLDPSARLQGSAVLPAEQRAEGDDPLLVAADRCDLEGIRIRLDEGTNPNLRREDDGWTPLLFAAQAGCAEGLRALIDAGADVDLTDDRGFFALYVAAQNGHTVAAQVLQESGAQVDRTLPSGDTSLLIAAFRGHLDIARVLVTAGATVNAGRDEDGFTPLLAATQQARLDVATMLLESGADPDRPNWNGETPLMVAAAEGDEAHVACDSAPLIVGGRQDHTRD